MAARQVAGFSITEAAQKPGFKNYQTLSAIEKVARNINAHELVMMARLYGRSLDYFLESDVAPDPVPLWRKARKTDVNQIQRQFLSFLENYSNLKHLLGLKRRWKNVQKNYDSEKQAKLMILVLVTRSTKFQIRNVKILINFHAGFRHLLFAHGC